VGCQIDSKLALQGRDAASPVRRTGCRTVTTLIEHDLSARGTLKGVSTQPSCLPFDRVPLNIGTLPCSRSDSAG
jgi:hypothetical protein